MNGFLVEFSEGIEEGTSDGRVLTLEINDGDIFGREDKNDSSDVGCIVRKVDAGGSVGRYDGNKEREVVGRLERNVDGDKISKSLGAREFDETSDGNILGLFRKESLGLLDSTRLRNTNGSSVFFFSNYNK